MRLIDADKLIPKHFVQRSEYPTGYSGTQPTYDYTDVIAYDIDGADIVEAIPIEWISDYIHKAFDDESKAQDIIVMCYVWNLEQGRKENETN